MRVLRKIFGLRWTRLQKVEKTTQRRALWSVLLTKRYLGDHVKNNEMNKVWKTAELHKGIWWGDLKEVDHSEDLGVDRRLISKWIFKKWDGEARTGLICFRIERGGGRL